MPRELFDQIVTPAPTLGTRQWYTVPLSILSHSIALVVIVATPVLATRTLPTPAAMVSYVARLPAPEPPPLPEALTPRPTTVTTDTPEVTPFPSTATELGAPASGLSLPGLPTSGAVGPVSLGSGPAVALTPAPATDAGPPQAQAAVPVGGDVKPPSKIHDVQPVYPGIARSARAQGTVVLEAIISKDGSVTNVRVLRSIAMLDQAAIDAVRQWRYTPPTLNGRPVDVVMNVRVSFQLR